MLSVLILAASAAIGAPSPPAPGSVLSSQTAIEADPFVREPPLSNAAMSKIAGGEETAVDISQLGLNVSSSNGVISGVNVGDGSGTGAIADNIVNGNSGITAVFNNTGNGVIFQNTIQVNVFLNGPQ
ncbi:MAG: hypothetical protein ACOZAA_09650 [Pseudomonadota bacterium]